MKRTTWLVTLTLILLMVSTLAVTAARAEESAFEEYEAAFVGEVAEASDVVAPVDEAVSVDDGATFGDAEPELAEAPSGEVFAEAASAEGLCENADYYGSLGSAMFSAGTTARSIASHTVDIEQNGSTVTVVGSIAAPHTFYGLFVDATLVAPVVGSSVNQTIDVSGFSTGYHTVWLAVIVGTDTSSVVDIIFRQYIEVNKITDTPTYAGALTVYNNSVVIYPYDMYLQNQAGDLYMEFSTDGVNWTRSGYMRANLIQLFTQQNYTIDGLSPNTTYQTRLRYGTYVNYSLDGFLGDDQDYFFGGPALGTATIRTGMAAAPAIKSVTIQSTKIKYHRVRHAGYYNYVGGSLFWHKAYTEKFYTCKFKVTVKLKQAPGTNGIFITCAGQTKYVRGNKKTYTATFTPYPNYFAKKPKGRYKYSVSVCSGMDANWGGYSPSWSGTKKLK